MNFYQEVPGTKPWHFPPTWQFPEKWEPEDPQPQPIAIVGEPDDPQLQPIGEPMPEKINAAAADGSPCMTPDVAESDGVGDAAHGEVELRVPRSPLGRQAARVAAVASAAAADHVAALVHDDHRRVVGILQKCSGNQKPRLKTIQGNLKPLSEMISHANLNGVFIMCRLCSTGLIGLCDYHVTIINSQGRVTKYNKSQNL